MRIKVYQWIQSFPFKSALVIGLLVRLVSLGAYPLMDTTEARYGEMGRKMLETGNWLTPQFDYGVPFWGKPPLSIWLTATSFKLFGVNEFSARLPSFIVGLLIIALIFKIAENRHGKQNGWVASTIFATSLLPFVMIGTVIMDPALTLGTTLAMVGFWLALDKKSPLWGHLFFVGLAIGLLAKGPVALVLSGLPIGLWIIIQKKWRRTWQCLPIITGSILLLLLTLPWYLMAEKATPGFLEYFLIGEHWKRFTVPGWSGDLYGTAHKEPYGKIWLFALEAIFPWFLVLPIYLKKNGWQNSVRFAKQKSAWLQYLTFWFITPLLFFTFAGNILMTYVLPGIPAFAILCAEMLRTTSVQNGAQKNLSQSRLRYAGFVMPSIIALALLLSLTFKPWKSENLLLKQYNQIVSEKKRLYYVPERPFSAEFYSNGKAVKLENLEKIPLILKDGKQNFFAVRSYLVDSLKTQFGDQVKEIARSKRFVLFRTQQQ